MPEKLVHFHKRNKDKYFVKGDRSLSARSYITEEVSSRRNGNYFSIMTKTILSNIDIVVKVNKLGINALQAKMAAVNILFDLINKNQKLDSPMFASSSIGKGYMFFLSVDVSTDSCAFVFEIDNSKKEIKRQANATIKKILLDFYKEKIKSLDKLLKDRKLKSEFNNYVDIQDYEKFRSIVISIIQKTMRDHKELKYPSSEF